MDNWAEPSEADIDNDLTIDITEDEEGDGDGDGDGGVLEIGDLEEIEIDASDLEDIEEEIACHLGFPF